MYISDIYISDIYISDIYISDIYIYIYIYIYISDIYIRSLRSDEASGETNWQSFCKEREIFLINISFLSYFLMESITNWP